MPDNPKKNPDHASMHKRLTIIQALVFGLPFLFVLFLVQQSGLLPDRAGILYTAIILLLILAGLVMLRRFFEKLMDFTVVIKKAASGQVEFLEKYVETGELAGMAGAFNDVLGRMEETSQELEQKISSLSFVKEMLLLSGQEMDMESLLTAMLEKTMDIADARIGSVFMIEPGSGKLCLVHYRGVDDGPPEDFPFDSRSPVMARVMESKKSLRVADIESDPRIKRENQPRYGGPSFIAMPIFAGSSLAGILNLARKKGKRIFDEKDEEIISMAVSEMGYVLQNAFLTARLDEFSRNREKLEMLLNELRDEKGQMGQRLRHAQKLEAIGILAGGVAHDFNNLLMAIQGNVSIMLLELKEGLEQHTRLKNIEKHIESGSRLTSQLLGFARKSSEGWQKVHINNLVQESLETFGRTRKDILIKTELKEGLSPVLADPSQMEQMLWNLYINAGDAMSDGGSLHITTSHATEEDMAGHPYSPKPGSYIMFYIKDTGPGMNSEVLNRIFEPFFTTKEKGKGTGLGLAQVFEVVKQHGGYIDAESVLEQGTAFRIFLPFAPDEF